MPTKPIAVVTGAAGFIGSHMTDLLVDRGYAVRGIDNLISGREANLAQHSNNPDVSLEALDIRALRPDSSLVAGARLVIHFAGIGDIVPSIERPSEYMSSNVQGTVGVLEAARHARVAKFVYAASSSCYGLAATPTREDHPITPQYPYALSKYMGEQAVFHWGQVYKLPVNSIRIFNAYGTRSRTSGAYGAVIGVFLRQKLAGKPFTVVGDGTQRRDFIYVTDVAEAFLAAAETEKTAQVWNIGSGEPQPINRLVEFLGGDREFIPKRPGEPDITYADISKIKGDLGWKPTVPFKVGVERVLANIDHWRDAPLWTANSIAQATETWFRVLSDNGRG